jgi:chromosome segregation ATPase
VIDDLEAKHAEALAAGSKDIPALHDKITELTAALEASKKEYSTASEGHTKELGDLKESHVSALATLKAGHDDTAATHASTLEDLKKSHAAELATAKSGSDDLAAAQEQNNLLKEQLQALADAHKKELTELEEKLGAQHKKELSDSTAQNTFHQDEIEELKTQIQTLEGAAKTAEATAVEVEAKLKAARAAAEDASAKDKQIKDLQEDLKAAQSTSSSLADKEAELDKLTSTLAAKESELKEANLAAEQLGEQVIKNAELKAENSELNARLAKLEEFVKNPSSDATSGAVKGGLKQSKHAPEPEVKDSGASVSSPVEGSVSLPFP